MFKEVTNNLVTLIGTLTTDFPAGSVERGEPGKVNIIKSNACLIMPDFQTVEEFSQQPGEYAKQVPFYAECFIISGKQFKTLAEAEDSALDLIEKVISVVTGTEQQTEQKYFFWELSDVEWYDRSANMCVVKLEFKVYLQV